MVIRIASLMDLRKVGALAEQCIAEMRSRGIEQWDEQYPTIGIFEADIQSGSLYCLEEQADLLGIIALNEAQSPEYGQVNWLTSADQVLVIHRLAVIPKRQKQGVGSRLLDFAENFALQNNYGSIRLDAYSANPGALRLYEKRGYQKVGQVRFPSRKLPFFCYEKVIGSESNISRQ